MKNGTKRFTTQQVHDHCKRHGFQDPLDNNRLQNTELERTFLDEPLDKNKRKEARAGRIIVGVRSLRQRLLDFDNLVGGTKFLLDALRYSSAIPDDREADILLQVSQAKVEKKNQERTIVTITYP